MAYSADTAFERFTEAGQTYGGFISHHDVEYILQINEDLPKSGIDGAPLIEVLERRQWELLRRFDLFKSMMLEEYAMLLVNVRGQGYRIANPNEHAEIAATSFADDVGKAVKNSRRMLEHVNKGRLTASESARHAEVEVRLAGLSVHIRNNLPANIKYSRRKIG